ncbi:MAG: 3-dehydroquinate synthase [Terriglobales bacterium]
MSRVSITVPPRPYEAIIEAGLLARAGARLRELPGGRERLFVITVAPVRRKWAAKLKKSLAGAGFKVQFAEMPDGEHSKRLATVERLAEKLVGLGADRDAVVVAFGGGVVGDVAGLVASLYMRGVDVVQIPTTVLAQVDASIGGKTGVNLRAGKNLVGTFHQPRMVLIDPEILSTLPEREFRAGLYEVLKCGVIGRPELFRRLEEVGVRELRRDAALLEWIIGEAVKLKAEIVAADEREGGLRRVLNFGHTVGHALEAVSRYRGILHGEAVAWGMIAATEISRALRKCDELTARRIEKAVLGLGPLPRVKARASDILRAIRGDKKSRDGVVHWVLPREIGKVEMVGEVPEEIVVAAMSEIGRLSREL